MNLISCTGGNEDVTKPVTKKYCYRIVKGKIKKGNSLYSSLIEKNVKNINAYKITNALNKIFNLHYTHPNDSFCLFFDSLKTIRKLEYYPNKIDIYIVSRDTADNFIAEKREVQLNKDIRTFSCQINSSLYESFINEGMSPELVLEYADIFQWDIDFFLDTRQGDTCKMVYEVLEHNGEIYSYGKILGASYKGRLFDLTAYYYNKGKKDGYYDKDGKSFQKAFLRSPLNYSFISSYYGMRVHPITKKVWLHNGVDYAAPRGTPIQASCDGTIIHIGWKGGHPTPKGNVGGYGNTIIIKHANGYKTLYGHLQSYARGIYVGKKVKQKDIIGYVGSTGWSTGPHLHYTIYQYDRPINPFRLNNVSGPPVAQSEMYKFNLRVNITDKIIQNIKSPNYKFF